MTERNPGVGCASSSKARPGWSRTIRRGTCYEGDGLVTITFTCGTITGTPANDRINGTAGDDVICGLGGKDLINGLGGDDVLLGGAGDDRLIGESGADELDGGSGRDYASFDSGAVEAVEVDLSTNEVAHDGRGFADTITEVEFVQGAKNQANTLTGDAAANRLVGGVLVDLLTGGAGADALRGEYEFAASGAGDTLDGGDGDDRLFPGLGSNTIAGGTGSDTLDYSRLGEDAGVLVVMADGSGTASVSGGRHLQRDREPDRDAQQRPPFRGLVRDRERRQGPRRRRLLSTVDADSPRHDQRRRRRRRLQGDRGDAEGQLRIGCGLARRRLMASTRARARKCAHGSQHASPYGRSSARASSGRDRSRRR